MKIMDNITHWLKGLLLTERQKRREALWQQLRDEVAAQVRYDLRAEFKAGTKRPKALKRETRPPLNTGKLKQVRNLFNSEFVSRETNRHNQKAWVKAMRILHDSRADLQVSRLTLY
jgi:hypothetical protein